jgi:squalene synthase HpnC
MIHRAFGSERAAAPPPLPDSLELTACYRYCEALARSRHHNFPVASLFVPERIRPHIMAIYAFARTADDFADEPQYERRRALELDRWEEQLEAMFHGEPATHPVFVALAETARVCDLPITPFQNLLSGFRTDLERSRFATYADLRQYTALAAGPVGELFLYLVGYREPALHRMAEELASGLALANFWQDLPTDVARGRLYVPSEDLLHFGVAESDLAERRRGAAVRALIRFEVARTRALFERARPLIDSVGPDIAVEVAMMWLGGMRILDKIHSAGEHGLLRRPRLGSADKAYVVARALLWRGSSLIRRGLP